MASYSGEFVPGAREPEYRLPKGSIEYVEGEEPVRSMPVDEQVKYLESRYEEAETHIEKGRQLIHEWEPVAKSCMAGLEVLKTEPRVNHG